MARTIESPGVQITEIDLSLNASLPIGTNVLVNGFTDQGPSQELLHVTSIEEFEQIYGTPTNAAERYAYHTTRQVLQSPAKVVFNRLPYGSESGEGYNDINYTVLMYPMYSVNGAASGVPYSASGDLLIGKPTQVVISEDQYIAWQQGNIPWESTTLSVTGNNILDEDDIGKAGLVIINKIQTTVNQEFEGYYIGISDNLKSSTTTTSPDFEFTSIQNIQTSVCNVDGVTIEGNWKELTSGRLDFELSGNISNKPNSISEAIETIPTWDFGAPEYRDGIIIGLYKFSRSAYTDEQNQLRFTQYESHVGSLGAGRRYTDPTGFQEKSFFIESEVGDTSTFLDVMVNPNLAAGNWLGDDGLPSKTVRVIGAEEVATDPTLANMQADSAFSLGLYEDKASINKDIGVLPKKLELGLRLAEDWETIPLDIVLDGGLSTINATMNVEVSPGVDPTEFDDTRYIDITELEQNLSSNISNAWYTIVEKFDTFCRDTRKDCMVITDVYRNILIKGKNYKTLDDKRKNFSQHIYTPLKNLTAIANSSYAATYAQWIKVFDNASNDYAWVPYSGFQGAIMCKLDSVLYSWSAPAGLNNGLVVGALDVALASTQKQRDLLYRNNLNAVVFFPADGIVCWGQKTLQKKPSAFDRINVRRLFLTLEKATRSIMKYFVFEPNTVFTRTRVNNVLEPIFEVAKNNEGVYDYRIICDERNNTPHVIDNNEMVVDIYLKPVRTAEFILVNFYATRTDQNFDELI